MLIKIENWEIVYEDALHLLPSVLLFQLNHTLTVLKLTENDIKIYYHDNIVMFFFHVAGMMQNPYPGILVVCES